MAAITLDNASKELTQVRAENPSALAPIESGARVRIKKFSLTLTGVIADAATIELAEFGKDVSIVGGALTTVTIAGSGALDIGWTPTASPVDTNVSAFGTDETAAVAFDPALVTTTEATTVFATVDTADLAAADVIEGYILYVENS